MGAIAGSYKSAVTKRINALRQASGAAIWQRGYYQHGIRDADDYESIAAYIADNPHHWAKDADNPVGDDPINW